MLTVNLHRATNPTVSEVTRDVFPPGFITPFFSLGAAPRCNEPSCLGAGGVDHALEDEGELAGFGAEGSTLTGGRVTVAPVSYHVVPVAVSGGGAPRLLEPSSQGALVVGPTLQYMAM